MNEKEFFIQNNEATIDFFVIGNGSTAVSHIISRPTCISGVTSVSRVHYKERVISVACVMIMICVRSVSMPTSIIIDIHLLEYLSQAAPVRFGASLFMNDRELYFK